MKQRLLKAFMIGVVAFSAMNVYADDAHRFPEGVDISSRFTGTVHRNDMIRYDESHEVPAVNVVSFEPGSYSGWHVHGGMTLIGISGEGIYQGCGKLAVKIRAGEKVHIPEGVVHWHGATKDSKFQHFVVYEVNWKSSEPHQDLGTISKEDYENLTFVEAEDQSQAADTELLFKKPTRILNSPNFTKPVGLSIVLADNPAQSPPWGYVDFPAGAYNKWHSHKTGQFLIATDGVGYHQRRFGAIEELKPGDVVYVGPNEVHWHGAGADHAFAHIAISPQDNHDVTWYDFLEEDVYQELTGTKGRFETP